MATHTYGNYLKYIIIQVLLLLNQLLLLVRILDPDIPLSVFLLELFALPAVSPKSEKIC